MQIQHEVGHLNGVAQNPIIARKPLQLNELQTKDRLWDAKNKTALIYSSANLAVNPKFSIPSTLFISLGVCP